MKKNNNKGFTLMEMLIVVAIIAILVAIAIPTFTGSLNKAREAADEANARSAYAEVMANYMTADKDAQKDGVTAQTSKMQADMKSDFELHGVDDLTWEADQIVTFTAKQANNGDGYTVTAEAG